LALIELGNPELLFLAPLLIALTLFGHHFALRIKRSIEVFHYPPVRRLARIVTRKGLRRSAWRGTSLGLKLTITILITFSLANPTVNTFSETTQTVEVPMVMEKDLAGQVVLAIDASASMGITDVSPSRLEATKGILLKFVQNASENVRFGVAAFDKEIRTASPLTADKARVEAAIGNLTVPEALPCLEEYTDIGYGLQTAIDLLMPYNPSNGTSAIILVSDGFANYGYPDPGTSVSEATARASSIEVPIFAVHLARLGQDSNDGLMKAVAADTKGKFLDSSNMDELGSMLDMIGKYYVPTHEWNSTVNIKTTLPVQISLGQVLMLVATAFVLALWAGNYKHYKTSF
jgi:Mg-chelatase subunit ChlD